jgi:succinyl-CoA synthetase alpha subunit
LFLVNLLGFIEQWKLIRCGFGSMSISRIANSGVISQRAITPLQAGTQFVQKGFDSHRQAHEALNRQGSDMLNGVTATVISRCPAPAVYATVNTAMDTGKRLLVLFSLDLLLKIRNLI